MNEKRRKEARRGAAGGDATARRCVVTACCLLADLYRGECTSHVCVCMFMHAINCVHMPSSLSPPSALCVRTVTLFMYRRLHAIRTERNSFY